MRRCARPLEGQSDDVCDSAGWQGSGIQEKTIMEVLFQAYPALQEAVDTLCGGVSWCITGASVLLYDETNALYLELTKPKHWQERPDGSTVIGIGGLGGSLEQGESILTCLERELQEEIRAAVCLKSAATTYLIYEQQHIEALALEEAGHPRPLLLTISKNLYRQHAHPEAEILAIVTFDARLSGAPRLGDLFGILRIPHPVLSRAFEPDEIPLDTLIRLPGVEVQTQQPLPPKVLLRPVWTGRSLQLLLQATYRF